MAANPPVRKPLPPVYVPPVYSWTGFYVGANLGYGWAESNKDWNFFAQNSLNGSTICRPTGGAICASGNDATKLSGTLGGFQTGYNWQISNWLAGIETDFQFSGQRGSQTFNTDFFAAVGGAPGALSATYTERLEWLGTLRGRVGFAADRWLLYATGGLAYGRLTDSGSSTATGAIIFRSSSGGFVRQPDSTARFWNVSARRLEQ